MNEIFHLLSRLILKFFKKIRSVIFHTTCFYSIKEKYVYYGWAGCPTVPDLAWHFSRYPEIAGYPDLEDKMRCWIRRRFINEKYS